MERFELLSDDGGRRIDAFLAEELPELSRSRIQRLISEGAVLVNGETVGKSYKLRRLDRVTACIEEAVTLNVEPEDIPLDVRYEDDELIVVNKPQGMVVHPAAGHSSGTLVNALLHHCRGGLSGINGVMRPGIVHRIDRDTSGLIVAAKTDRAHNSLSLQLMEHSVSRVYKTLVFGNIKEDGFAVDLPLGRSSADRKKMAVTKNGKRAVTHIRVLMRFGKYTLAEARLETGRTHQIRVHLSHMGYPVVGDEVYGRLRQPFNTRGQLLHAELLGFRHPVSDEYIELSAELPELFLEILAKL